MALDVPKHELNEWLQELKPYQQATLKEMLSSCDPQTAAEKWVRATGSAEIVPFGGKRDGKTFWEDVKSEFRKFVCDEDSYVDEKKALSGQKTRAALVSIISAAVGATVGSSATLLAPAIVLLLFTVGKIGRNAYCRDGD